MDNKLVYLKEKFLSNFKLFIFDNNHKNDFGQSEALKEFNTNSVHFRNNILHATTKEEFVEVLNEIRVDYLDKWATNFHHHNDTDLYSKFYDVFFDTGINNINEWVENTEQMYEDKLKFNYFNKIQNFLGIDKNPEKNITKLVERANNFNNNEKLNILLQSLIKKYDLCYIDLNSSKNVEDALKFLNKFDKEAEQVAKDMNMPNEYIGIKGTLSISYNKTNQAFYMSKQECMSFSHRTASKSTILHEWIHALDNHICKKHLLVNGYVSHQKGLLVEDSNTSVSRAYHTMRKITQDVFNSNEKEVNHIIEGHMRSGLCRFWSVILGDQWYSITKEDREAYFSKDIQKDVLNYLVNPNNPKYVSDLEWNIRKKGVYHSSDQILKIMDSNLDYLQENVAPYFRNISENMIGKKSFYFHTANISNIHIIVESFVKNIINKGKEVLHLPESEEIKTNMGSGYFIEPCEMVARYFESQVYRTEAVMYNLLGVVGAYKMDKDKHFETKKNNLLNLVFNKEGTMNKIGSVRNQFHPATSSELKIT